MSFSIENITEWPHVEKLATDFPQLTIELFVGSVQDVLRPLYEENLKEDYAKGLKGEPPEYIDIGNFVYDASRKTERNQGVVERVQKCIEEKNTDRFAFYRLFYIVRLDGKPVGTLEIYKDGPHAVQYGVFTDRDHSKRGIGTAVLNAATKMLKEKTQLKQVFYECNADNTASNHLALKTGFKYEKEFRVYGTRMANRYCLELE